MSPMVLAAALALAVPPAVLQELPQIPACKFVSALTKTPCAARLAASTVLPALIPLEARGLHFTKTVADLHNKVVVQRLQKFEAAGYKWLGKPDKHLVPGALGVELDLGVQIDSLAIDPVTGLGDLRVTARGSAEVQVTGVLTGGADERDFKGKKFTVAFELGGQLLTTDAPGADACQKAPPDWAMEVFAFTFDDLKSVKISGAHAGVRVPDAISDSKTFLSLINWAVGHLYRDLDQFHTRGIAVCLTRDADHKPNCPRDVQKQDNFVLRVGKGSSDVTVDFSHLAGKPPRVAIGNDVPLCGLAGAILADQCSGALFNGLSQSILPIRRPIPKELIGTDGIFLVAKALQTATSAAGATLTAKLAVAKAGQPDFDLDATGTLAVTPHCTQRSLALELHARLTQLGSSPKVPGWLLDGVGRTAVNLKLAAHGPIELPLAPRKLKQLDQEVSTCAVARALLKTATADAVANAIGRAVLPFNIPAKAAVAELHLPPAERKLLRAVDDLSLILTQVEAKKGAGASQKVRVTLVLRKAKQAEALTTEASLTISAKAECGAGRNVLVLRPRVEQLQASRLPPWLLGSTVLDVANAALSRPTELCAAGPCTVSPP